MTLMRFCLSSLLLFFHINTILASKQVYMGISTYDPFNNFEYIFASPTDSSNFTKDGRLFQVEYNTREFNLIPLRSSGVAFTTIEFDPESLSLLGTYTNVGKPSHFGQINVQRSIHLSYRDIGHNYSRAILDRRILKHSVGDWAANKLKKPLIRGFFISFKTLNKFYQNADSFLGTQMLWQCPLKQKYDQ